MNKLEHIGIAVRNLEESNRLFTRLLGVEPYKMETVEREGVRTSFFRVGDVKIELLESTRPGSAIDTFIEKRGEGIHHMAYAVKGIENAISELESKGVQMIDKAPRKGAEGLHIAFMHPKSSAGVLTEICEDKNK